MCDSGERYLAIGAISATMVIAQRLLMTNAFPGQWVFLLISQLWLKEYLLELPVRLLCRKFDTVSVGCYKTAAKECLNPRD